MTENETSNINHALVMSNFKFNPISQALAVSFFLLFSGPSSANCIFSDKDVTCDTDNPNPYTSEINLVNVDNANITINSNSTLDVGNNTSAITAGTNATLTFKSGSTTHNTNGSSISDMLNLRNGSHVIVEENALLNSEGFNSQSETIQLAGGSSSVDNKGTILSQGAFAINLQDGKDNIINNSGIIHGYRGGIWTATNTEIIITNSGTIQGDTGVAIDLNSEQLGESATLILEEGSTIIGNVISNSSATNTLVLGGNSLSGSDGDSFSVDLIGNNSQYQRFSFFKKQGTSNWTLKGSASQDINWEIDEGTLTLGSSAQGNGTLNANGGNIGYLDGVELSNSIDLTQNADFIIDTGVASQNGVISGNGSLTKTGAGTLILGNENVYTGKTNIESGTLQIGNGGTSGNITGDIANSGTLNINHSNSVTLNGALSGTGGLNQIGTGTTTLAAQNSTQGAVTITSGTLDFAQAGDFTTHTLDLASTALLKLEDKARLIVSGVAKLDGEVDLNIINGGPLITADSITLGANSILNLTGASGTVPDYASQIPQSRTTVLQTAQGITGDFSSVELGYQTHLDYILFDGMKSADGKSYTIGEELAWTTTTNGATGNFTLANATDHFTVDVILADENTNALTGWDGKSLTKLGDGTLTLSADNTYSGGTTVNAGSVILAQDKAAGTGTVTVSNAGTLDIAFSNATFTNNVTGAGKVKISGTGVALGGDSTGFTGVWDVTGSANASEQSQLGNAHVLLDGTQSLLILDNFGDTFTSQLTGNGLLQISQNSTTSPFSFAASTGSAFTGTIEMQQGTLTLDANAEQTLTNSTLALTPNGIATMDNDRSIHSLILGGGTLQMDNSRTVTHTLTTETFNASAGGRIQANIPEELSPPVIPTNPSYFDQDVVRNVQVVKATDGVTGVGNHLDLYNFDGSALAGSSLDVGIIDVGVKLGTATYDQAAVVTEDGAWVGFDLVELDASAGQTLKLENQPGMDNMLVAKLTGEGNFDIHASGTVILNNHSNDYTGDTLISSGNLQLGSDNALGHTKEVSIASGTGLDINGKTQAITTLHGAADSNLNLNGGNLTIAQGGESAGTLEGSGNLNLNGGELVINGANQNFSASTRIAQPATATLNDIQGLGNGAINVDGTLNLIGANGTMTNLLSGNGSVALEHAAQVTLNNTARTFAGNFNVATGTQLTAQEAGSLGTATVTNNGTLELNNNADWALTNAVSGSGGVNKTGTGTLFADQNMTYTGDTHITAGALQVNGDFASTGTLYVEQAGALKGNGSVAGSVINSGIIDLTSATQNNALTINGDYDSHDGKLWVNSELNGDNSAHDELFVKGNTRGNTDVTVKDMHGLGAQTADGIELVNVQGQSDGTFALQGRAVAGAYEYKLYQGTAAENDGNWYLRSTTDAPTPPDPTPPTPVPDSPVLRPEAGAYLANQSLANSVFMSTMHDRNAENRQTGEDSPAVWAHLDVGHINSKAGGDQLSMGSNITVLRIGSDVYRHDFGTQQIKAGLMTGYAHANTDSDAKHVGDSAKGTLEGYNFGVYGTWFGGRAEEKSGPYADTWMQYGTFHNTVKGDDLAEEKYHAHNWAGSLELGYGLPVSDSHALYLQPQFQTIYSHYSQGDHTEDNGTRIHSQDSGGVTTRLGVRLSGQLDEAGKAEPFVELNW